MGESRALHALVVDGSPEPSSPELVATLASGAEYVVAADRGAAWCRTAGVVPHVFCGDADTIPAGDLAWVESLDVERVVVPADKYVTDLTLALDLVRERAQDRGLTPDVTVTCASGGRPEHQLAVFGCLAANADLRPRIVEDGLECRVISPVGAGCWELGEGAVGHTLSVIAVTPGTVVSEQGMHWDLDHRELPVLDDLGISNRVELPGARVTCHEGCAAVFLR